MTSPLWPYMVVMTGKEETPIPISQPQDHPQPSQKELGYGVRTLDSATSLLCDLDSHSTPVTQFSLQTELMGYSPASLNSVATS